MEDNPLEEIACPSCGSSFGVIGDEGLAFETEGGTLHRRQSFGHFELTDQLGAGAFGVVWQAQDKQLDRTVVLKIPRKSQLSREETEKFIREARAAAQLRYPELARGDNTLLLRVPRFSPAGRSAFLPPLTVLASVEVTAGKESRPFRSQASADEGGPTGSQPFERRLRGPCGEPSGLRQERQW